MKPLDGIMCFQESLILKLMQIATNLHELKIDIFAFTFQMTPSDRSTLNWMNLKKRFCHIFLFFSIAY